MSCRATHSSPCSDLDFPDAQVAQSGQVGTLWYPLVKMGRMENFDISIECGTCVATGTTACADCIVTHLLANDDGPIDLVMVPVAAPLSVTDRAIALLRSAGLVDDPVEFVSVADFDGGVVATATT